MNFAASVSAGNRKISIILTILLPAELWRPHMEPYMKLNKVGTIRYFPRCPADE